MDNLPSLITKDRSDELVAKSRAAHEQLGETFAELRSLLSPRAARIIDKYFGELASSDVMDTTAPRQVHHAVAAEARRDFNELFQVEIGPELGFGRHSRRLRRWVWLAWHRMKSMAGSARWRIRTWIQDQQIRFGPQLTQADVRTPPRYKHFKTVEEMEKQGWPKVRIQRHLREQQRADPRPWEPLPPPGPGVRR